MNSMEVADKFRKIRKAKKMTQPEFGKLLMVGAKQISAIEKGTNKPSARVMEFLFDRHKVSRSWWETGEGEMFEAIKKPQVPEHLRLLFEEIAKVFPDSSSLVQKHETLSRVMKDLREEG